MKVRTHAPILVATAALILLVLLVDPRGEFPLNDDWDFASTSWKLGRTWNYEVGRYTAVALRTQALAGALWSRIFEESFTALRILTLITFASSLLILDRLLLLLRATTLTRYVVLFSWLGSPLTLLMAFSFMTQIYAATALMAATLLLFKGRREQKPALLAASAMIVIAAVLIRQNAAIWFVALIVSAMPERRSKSGKTLITTGALALSIVAWMLITTAWLTPPSEQFSSHSAPTGIEQRWESLSRVLTAFPQHAALTFAPCVIAFALLAFHLRSARVYAMLIASLCLFLLRADWMPGVSGDASPWSMLRWPDVNFGSVLANFTLGPPTLTDIGREGSATPFAAPDWLRGVVTAFAAVGGAVAVVGGALSWLRTRGSETAFEFRFIAIFLLAGMGMLGAGNFYFDRYVVDVGWPLLLLAAPAFDRFEKASVVALIAAACLIVASSMGVFEYLAWNRARWALVERAPMHGVDLSQLDGGYEVNAWLPRRESLDLHAPIAAGTKQFLITFNPLPGGRVIDHENFGSFRKRALYLIEMRGPADR